MGIIKSNKTASKQIIKGKESFFVKLCLESEPIIKENPKDIVLILDESGSMSGEPLEAVKKGANHFVDIINKSTGGVAGGTIGGGSHISVVSFSNIATIETALTDKVPSIKMAINGLKAGGTTDHETAFGKGVEALKNATNDKIMIIFTDGQANPGREGYAIADQAKADGTTIYSVGYGTPDKIDVEMLKKWASDPIDDHVLVTPNLADIESLFETLAERISEPRATNISLTDKINPCFEIVSSSIPKVGTVSVVDKQTIVWQIPSLGAQGYEKAELDFTVVDKGTCTGVLDVDERYVYSDNEGNTIDLPNPQIEIVSTTVDVKEECPQGHEFIAEPCTDYVSFNAGDITLENLGRIVEVGATIKNVCPNRQLAVAFLLTEIGEDGIEYQRGLKTLLVPAHTSSNCTDVKVECVKFVLPEALVVEGNAQSLCNARNLSVRVIANYVDTDYTCCKA